MSFLQFLKADGAEEKDCIQQNEAESQPAIQPPAVQMDTQNLRRQEEEACITSCCSAASSFLECENRNQSKKRAAFYVCTHSERDGGQQQNHRVHQAFAVDCHLQTKRSVKTFTEPQYNNATVAKVRGRKDIGLYHRSVADYEGPQCPGETQTQQHIEYIATDGVGHSHVTHS